MQNKKRFNLIGARNIWFGLSVVIIVVGVASLSIKGLNYGVDFTGGRILQFRAGQKINTNDVERIVRRLGIAHNPAQLIGHSGREFVLRTKDYSEEKRAVAFNEKIRELLIAFNVELHTINPDKFVLLNQQDKLTRPRLNAALKKAGFPETAVKMAGTKEIPAVSEKANPTYEITLKFTGVDKKDYAKLATGLYMELDGYRPYLNEDKVDPIFGLELKKRAFIALLLATAGILLYVTIRFEFWYAIAAIIALVHDTAITLGATSLLGIEVNGAFVAVILTVFGYSINDTIVIFDRIRENLRKDKKTPLDLLMNISLWETMPRSINTVLTTEITILAILIFGGESLSDFIKAMLIGVGCGCFSSIFVAAPLAFVFKSAEAKRKGEAAVRGATPAGKPKAASAPRGAAPAKDRSKKTERPLTASTQTSAQQPKKKTEPAQTGAASSRPDSDAAGGGEKKKKKSGGGGKQRRR